MAKGPPPIGVGSKTSYPKGGAADKRAKGEAIPKTDRENERQDFPKNTKGGKRGK